MHEFEKALDKINWDIVDFWEIRREGTFLKKRNNGNYLYYFQDTVRISKIKNKARAKDIGYLIEKQKFNYAGRTAREIGKWYKLVEEWTPTGP